MRAISAPTSAARFSKFSGQFFGPYLELLVVSCQSLEMLLLPVSRCKIPGCRMRHRPRHTGDTQRIQKSMAHVQR